MFLNATSEKEIINMQPQYIETHRIFIAGGSGYIGRSLIPLLLEKKHYVSCLVREKSISKLPVGCKAITGNALDGNSYKEKISPADTFIHLVGVSHPRPSKAEQFKKVDLVSLQQSVEASLNAGIKHFIYLSVAHPAPVMKEYIKVREECEEILLQSGLKTTILRPWYVLGPGHRWPYLLIPFYKLIEMFPSKAESAERLGLVTLKQMTKTLIDVVENPVEGNRIIEVPDIRNNIY